MVTTRWWYLQISHKGDLNFPVVWNISFTKRFVSGNICSEGLNRLEYSGLIAVKRRDFFGETSP